MKIKKKLIKNFLIQQILAFILAIYILIVRLTSKIRYVDITIPQLFWNTNKPFILAFWHSQLMMISFCWKSQKKINILASKHSDGRFGAIVGKYFKLNNIPAPKNQNAFSLRSLYKKIESNDYIGITPDGPRGPKETVSEGIIKFARATNTPIIPCGFWSSNNFSLNSWDTFLVTLPFSSCYFVWKKPLYIPKSTKDSEIQHFQFKLKKMIDESINSAKKMSV